MTFTISLRKDTEIFYNQTGIFLVPKTYGNKLFCLRKERPSQGPGSAEGNAKDCAEEPYLGAQQDLTCKQSPRFP